ncbi:hypothetical protein V8C44DRAFT_315031 [Trichoderma aethiopicum]
MDVRFASRALGSWSMFGACLFYRQLSLCAGGGHGELPWPVWSGPPTGVYLYMLVLVPGLMMVTVVDVSCPVLDT